MSKPLGSGGPRAHDIDIAGSIDPTTGICSINAYDTTHNVDDDDDGYKFHGTWFELNFYAPSTGRIQITADFHINTSILSHSIFDETGVSAVDSLVFQWHVIDAWKVVGGTWVQFGHTEDHYHEKEWTYGSGVGDKHYVVDASNVGRSVVLVTDNDAEAGQFVSLQVGTRGGITFWTNDYGISAASNFDARLDKVVAQTV